MSSSDVLLPEHSSATDGDIDRSQGQHECSICFEAVGEAAMHCLGSFGQQHHFHGRCLAAWVQECQRGSRIPSCPNCRGPVEIHTERLASQVGEGTSVHDFLTTHASQDDRESVADGWVRVGGPGRHSSILEGLKSQFRYFDVELMAQRHVPATAGITRANDGGDRAAIASHERAEVQLSSDDDDAQIPAPQWSPGSPCEIVAGVVQSELEVGDVKVLFPFADVLAPQKEVISSTVRAVLEGKNVLVESPTGTGKTMALLCGALAAQRHFCEVFGKAPRILFCTRTHRQIKQVVRELRRSPYRPWLQVAAGREQGLCLETSVLQSAREHEAHASQVCQVARRQAERRRAGESLVVGADGRAPGALPSGGPSSPSCRYWTPLADSSVVGSAHREMRGAIGGNVAGVGMEPRIDQSILDVEDLGALGRRIGACPYFLSRAALSGAEVVVCPYNYVLDSTIAASTGLLGDKSVIIFDEGHNIEDHCCDAGSVSISSNKLAEIERRIEEALQYLFEFHNEQGINFSVMERVKASVREIRDFCVDMIARSSRSSFGHSQEEGGCITWNSSFESDPSVLDFLDRSHIEPSFLSDVSYFQDALQERSSNGTSRLEGLALTVLRALNDLHVFAKALDACRGRPSHYKIHLTGAGAAGGLLRSSQGVLPPHASQTGTALESGVRGRDFELSVVNVHPEAVFQSIAENAHCIVIASGTLAPVESFAAELGCVFGDRLLLPALEASHVIEASQFGVAFVGQSRRGLDLRCVSDRMSDRAFLVELGCTVFEIAVAIPGGVLVFFPSRSSLDMAVRVWQEPYAAGQSLWDALAARKKHVGHEGGREDAAQALARHEEAVLREGSAVFFCVYRGQFGEGLSLSDDAVRGVVCVGIPLPPLKPAVRLKRLYNDAVAASSRIECPRMLDGDTWYRLGAYRAVNQALGRVVRHRGDHGVAVLIDERWTASGSLRAAKYLPLWLRRLVGIHDNKRGDRLGCPVGRLLGDIRRHFSTVAAATTRRIGPSLDAAEPDGRRVRPRP
eukprot:TRINITY_DN63462_c0_g1_i1.p1 TRINITY_DN63462_c0_g1~~TRINITY_DN63462_c0_g1_i1.p1  ORF type:complete len:1049 (+),score=115.86 TRINITY_DN63462_c0_g1_i1:74-3148(+)